MFHPERILILKMLLLHGTVDFRELREAIGLTDGNLSSHLRALEKGGIVVANKQFEGRRPRTSYELTPNGRKEFTELMEALKAVVE